MKKQYGELKAAVDNYVAGRLSSDELKPFLAPSGIYQQRNDLFMARVRITGGEISGGSLIGLADIAESCGGYAHLTSRQDLQIHNVTAERIMEVVSGSDKLGLPFKGGGGNTYRNMIASADSGFSVSCAFDVYPYAHAIHRAVLKYAKAFALPRKLKIGFFAKESERVQAAAQDLGFVAQVREGRQGFTVYAGGGQGRESAVGVKLFDFLDGSNCLRATLALAALFYDHGDRANRQKARLRFVVKRLGAEAFLRLYLGYYADTKAPTLKIPPEKDLLALVPQLRRGKGGPAAQGFSIWETIAVQPTRFGDEVKSVRLYVPYGNLTGPQLRGLASLAKAYCPVPLRLLVTEDLLIPMVHVSALPEIFERLRGETDGLDLTFGSYKGHLATCVGAAVCRIGMVDTPSVADRLATELDRYLPPDTPEKLRLLRLVTDDLRISGCPNSCASHHVARIGIGCVAQRVDGAVQCLARLLVGAGVRDGVPCFSEELEPDRLIPVADLGKKVLDELAKRVAEEEVR